MAQVWTRTRARIRSRNQIRTPKMKTIIQVIDPSRILKMMLRTLDPSSHSSSACPLSSASCPACQVLDGRPADKSLRPFSSSSFSSYPPLHRAKIQPQPVLHYLALRGCTYPADSLSAFASLRRFFSNTTRVREEDTWRRRPAAPAEVSVEPRSRRRALERALEYD